MTFHSVIEANAKFSRATEKRLDLPKRRNGLELFKVEAGAVIRALPDGAVVLGLGGEHNFFYADEIDPPGRLNVIAIDISPEELALNKDVDATYVVGVSKHIELPDASAGLILSKTLLEHVDGVPSAIREMGRVLRPGATALHLVPCRYSLFGIGTRLLPFGPLLHLTLKLALWFRNENFGFEIHYDRCYPSMLEREFWAAGFSDVQLQVSWACEKFFLGIYLIYPLHAAYEQAVRRLRIRRLADYAIVRAVR